MNRLVVLLVSLSMFLPSSLAIKKRAVDPCPITRYVDHVSPMCQSGHYEDCNGRITGYWAWCQ